jgi:hypothetical protein
VSKILTSGEGLKLALFSAFIKQICDRREAVYQSIIRALINIVSIIVIPPVYQIFNSKKETGPLFSMRVALFTHESGFDQILFKKSI